MQKYVNLVDLVKSFPTSIFLQKSASLQPRTSLSKFGGKLNSSFIRLLNHRDEAADVGRADPRGAEDPPGGADAGGVRGRVPRCYGGPVRGPAAHARGAAKDTNE